MKKELCLLALIMFAKICNAQFPKGTKMIEWSMYGQYNSNSEEQYTNSRVVENSFKSYNLSFNPSFDIFIKENLMLGFGPTYRYDYNEYIYDNKLLPQYQESKVKTNYYGAMLSLRKYYLIKDGLYWFLGINAGYEYGVGTNSYSSSNSDSYSNDLNASTIFANVNGGFAYDFNKQWLLRGGIGNLGWTNNSTETKDDEGTLASKSSKSSFSFNAVYLSLAVSLILHE